MSELQQVEEEIARIRAEARSLREQIGDRAGEGPADSAELSSLIAGADQLDTLAEELEGRRETLKNQG
ncbi:hypothetical protein [Herbidospora mongoliensis]|uniref:hypothetical protein n=1 Tax=Herbidospora mongoliensis TaxID=688067 RepID=UPI000837147E|nr:hypothetical protein [Herbidospora mongoliensis]